MLAIGVNLSLVVGAEASLMLKQQLPDLKSADERFYSLAENDGTVSLISADPKAWKEEGRFKLPQPSAGKKPKGGIWAPPVISNGKLFLRDQELLFCYDVKAP